MFYKNTYQDISLSDEVINHLVQRRKFLFLFIAFCGLIYAAIYYGVICTEEVNIRFPLYYAFHLFWLLIYPAVMVIFLFHWNSFVFRARYYRLIGAMTLPVALITILLFMISAIFIVEPSAGLVHSIYIGHFGLFLVYLTKYLKLWKRLFSGETGQRYAQRIEQYNWTEDVIHPEINGPKDNNEVKNRPFYAKTFEKVGNVLVASGFILPMIFAMSATGTGGSTPVIVVELFAFLIAPFAYNLIAQVVTWYFFIKRLEIEKNVIIYNGVWLV